MKTTYAVKRLDVLINNAGAYFPKYRETPEGFESTLALNYLSPFLLTHHLIKQMEQTASDYGEARVINITSIMHKSPINWDDLNYKNTTYHSNTAYYQSKHLLTSFTYYLSRKLKVTGITVNCIHPGFVNTALAQADFPFPMNVIVPIVGLLIGETPEQAADTTVWLALSDEVKDINGEYVHHRKVKKSWPPTRDENAQTRLFNVTQSMLGEWLYIPTGADGRPDAGRWTGLMLWLQKVVGEPWTWRIRPEELGLFLEVTGWTIALEQEGTDRKHGVEFYAVATK